MSDNVCYMQMPLNGPNVDWLPIWPYKLEGMGVMVKEAKLFIGKTDVMANLNVRVVFWDVCFYIWWETALLFDVSRWISRTVQTSIYLPI